MNVLDPLISSNLLQSIHGLVVHEDDQGWDDQARRRAGGFTDRTHLSKLRNTLGNL